MADEPTAEGTGVEALPNTGGVIDGTEAGVEGAEFKGAPTAISHLCPGWPCAGFIPIDPGVEDGIIGEGVDVGAVS